MSDPHSSRTPEVGAITPTLPTSPDGAVPETALPIPETRLPSKDEPLVPETAVPVPLTRTGTTTLPSAEPTTFGLLPPGYELLGELGHGGMGVVYKARQIKADRIVALKMILAGAHASPAELARFRTEAEAVARVQHGGIVQVFDVGEHRGMPFFSLEYCPGGSLSERLRERPLTPLEAVVLIEALARAVHAAHQRNVLHRDLKPSNVLLAADGTPKVADFGLAKKLDDKGQTQSGTVMGTPSYMPPEQARGQISELGPTADVYSLGAVLYECLTGRPPFKAATFGETLLQVLSDDPVPPRRLNPSIPRDLETICLKCLAKEARKRYDTAEVLAEDLRRFRVSEPIAARPVRAAERLAKWARRRPAVAGLLAALCVLALTAGWGIAWSYNRAISDRRVAQAEALRASTAEEKALSLAKDEARQRAAADEERAKSEFRVRVLRRSQANTHTILADQLKDWPHNWRQLDQVPEDLRGPEWHFRRRPAGLLFTLFGHAAGVTDVAFSPDGRRLATASEDGTARVWDARTGEELLDLRGHKMALTSLAFAPDGRLATASEDGTVCLWDRHAGGEPRVWQRSFGLILQLTFSPTGGILAAVATDGRVLLLDARDGEKLNELRDKAHKVVCVSFRPDGRMLASGSDKGMLRVWDVATAQNMSLYLLAGAVRAVAFSPDGRRLAAGSDDRTIRIWDVESRKEAVPALRLFGPVRCVAFSPDGTRLATTTHKGYVVDLWESAGGRHELTLKGHGHSITSLQFSPDCQRLATGSDDGTVYLWDARAGYPRPLSLPTPDEDTTELAFHPDGLRLAMADNRGKVSICDRQTGQRLHVFSDQERSISDICFDQEGARLASVSVDGRVSVWDMRSYRKMLDLSTGGDSGHIVRFSPDGRQLATASKQAAQVWDAQNGRKLFELRGHHKAISSLVYSPDGRVMATSSDDATARLWDTVTGEALRTLEGHTSRILCAAFSEKGHYLCAVAVDGTTRAWDVQTGRYRAESQISQRELRGAVFSAGAERLLVVLADGSVRLYDPWTGQQMYQFNGADARLPAAFGGDGQSVALRVDKGVEVWDTYSKQVMLTLKDSHTEDVCSVCYSPDGRWLASSGQDGYVRLWDSATGRQLHAKRVEAVTRRYDPRRDDPATANYIQKEVYDADVAFSADSKRFMARFQNGSTRSWDVVSGADLPDSADFPILPAPTTSPDGRRCAHFVGNTIFIVDRFLGADETARRRRVTRFDPEWHHEETSDTKPEDAFAKAFHRAQLFRHQPQDNGDWVRLMRACRLLEDLQPAIKACNQILEDDPGLAPVYLRRASLRQEQGEWAAAGADLFWAWFLILYPPFDGWPAFAEKADTAGENEAKYDGWRKASADFAWAALLERDSVDRMHRLAWVQLAAGDIPSFRETCRFLLGLDRELAREKQRIAATFVLTGAPANWSTALRFAAASSIDAAVVENTANLGDWIAYTACLSAESGVAPDRLLALSRRAVAQERSWSHLETLGAALYRTARYDEAVKTLNEAIELNKGATPWMSFFLAMSHQRLGHAEQARKHFDAAKPAERDDWKGTLIYKRLRDEAEGLLKATK